MRFIENLCWLEIRFLQRIHKESKRHYVRQRAHCILLSYQKYQVSDLAIGQDRTNHIYMAELMGDATLCGII